MELNVSRLDVPVQDSICKVCGQQRKELWYLTPDTGILICDLRCKHDLELATEVVSTLISTEYPKLKLTVQGQQDAGQNGTTEEGSTAFST